jgi:hypothetical protein
MNVQIIHKTTDISEYVIDYTREQNICSGIGTLNITLSSKYTTVVNTWDKFVLFEEGRQVGVFYANIITSNQPDGKKIVYCQDGTKYLNDYFISDSYLIDYYSETGYWITKFLSDAGVPSYNVAGDGEPISNNTNLGLSSAYEQIVPLLQMSGWYMHFENDTCIIGDLLSQGAPTLKIDNTDILNIKLIKNDKLLRNRALVLGSTDPVTGGWITADLHRITNYNYDANDLRAAVVSNNAIPSKAKAKELASKMLSAFGDITIEKHIQVHGARNVKIGDFVEVANGVWSGIGLVTSVGSVMSREGLITNITLDEKCPRLFTCFNPQNLFDSYGYDFVYASTTTSGVFRKHLEGDTWYPFSSGLLNHNIVDLYVNKGVLSCIDVTGVAYTASESEGIWRPVTISGLKYNYHRDGGAVDSTFSGAIYARGIIHDKVNNHVRIIADNRPYPVEWNYFDWSKNPLMIATSPGNLAWVLDVEPYTRHIANTFPIVSSGDINICALDIENDGINDYTSILVAGSGIITTSGPDNEPNFGHTHFLANRYAVSTVYGDGNTNSAQNEPPGEVAFLDTTIDKTYDAISPTSMSTIYASDNYNDREFSYIRVISSVPHLFVYKIVNGLFVLDSNTTITLTDGFSSGTSRGILGLYKVSNTLYRYYYTIQTSLGQPVHLWQISVTPGGSSTNVEVYVSTNQISNLMSSSSIGDILRVGFMEFNGANDFNVNVSTIDTTIGTYTNTTLFQTIPTAGHKRTGNSSGIRYTAFNFMETNAQIHWVVTYVDYYNFDFGDYKNADVYLVYDNVSNLYYSTSKAPGAGVFNIALNYTFLSKYNYVDYLFTYVWYDSRDYAGGPEVVKAISICSDNTITVATTTSADSRITNEKDKGNTLVLNSKHSFPRLSYNASTNKYFRMNDFKTWGSSNFDEVVVTGLSALYGIYDTPDSIDDSIYIIGRRSSDSSVGTFGINISNFTIKKEFLVLPTSTTSKGLYGNMGNFFWRTFNTPVVIYVKNLTGFTGATSTLFKVMQRTGEVFKLVHLGISADRLDISNQFPIVAAGVGLYDTNILNSYLGTLIDVSVISPSGDIINDHRYMEVTDLISGIQNKYFIYSTPSGICQKLINYDSTLGESQSLFIPASGIPTQIETTTNLYLNQHIFTAISGSFFQMSLMNPNVWFEYKTGLPGDVVITRIRVDDRI